LSANQLIQQADGTDGAPPFRASLLLRPLTGLQYVPTISIQYTVFNSNNFNFIKDADVRKQNFALPSLLSPLSPDKTYQSSLFSLTNF
jgi:hypothetical protein